MIYFDIINKYIYNISVQRGGRYDNFGANKSIMC